MRGEPKCGGRGEMQGLSQWVQLYTGAQIYFRDLTSYFTYDIIAMLPPFSPKEGDIGFSRFQANESLRRTGLHLSLSAKSSFYLSACEISRSCRTASNAERQKLDFAERCRNANRFFVDSHWLEICKNPSMGPNGGVRCYGLNSV